MCQEDQKVKNNTAILYIVGQDHDPGWGFIGIFSKEEKAIKECINKHYFYAPITLNQSYHFRTRIFDNFCYPKRENRQ